MASSAGLPSGVYTSNIGQILQALDQRNKAGALGAAGFSSLLGSGGQGLGQANNLNLSGIGAQNTYGAAPYNTQAGIGANALTNLTNLTQLGNNQFALPQQSINDLMNYMTGGRSASALSANIGDLGFNQTAQGLGGLLGGANTLFGNNGMLRGGGGLGGLFGAGLGADPGGLAAATQASIADVAAGGLGAADVGGGAAAALPFALSA
jgi:hypothetical protein